MLIYSVLSAGATDFYFSSSSGNDVTGNGTQATPYATLTKAQSVMNSTAVANDRFFFKRGETFPGSLTVNKAGVDILTYGIGTPPLFSGWTTLSQANVNWTTVATNIYEITVTGGLSAQLLMCTVNGAFQHQGRTPNYNPVTDFGGGWYRTENHEADSALMDLSGTPKVALPSVTNWTGAQIVVRTYDYVIDTAQILTHKVSGTGSRLSFSSAKIYNTGVDAGAIPNGYGFFIQQDPRTLDQQGEWYYNHTATTKKFRIYLTSAPSNYTIRIPTVDRGIVVGSGVDGVIIDGIRFEGYNRDGVALQRLASGNGANNTLIQNCEFQWLRSAVFHDDGDCDGTSVIGCSARDISFVAFYGRNTGNFTVRESSGRHIGLWPGMGSWGIGYMFSWTTKNGGNFSRNYVDSVGWAGIRGNGSFMNIDSNVIKNYAMILNDVSGVYIGNTDTYFSNRTVRHNVIINGYGNVKGTPQENTAPQNIAWRAYGIYPDDFANNIEISHNVVTGIRDAAFLFHNNWNLNVHDNLFIGGGRQVGFISQYTIDTTKQTNNPTKYRLREMTFKNNILIAKNRDEYVFKMWNWHDSSNYRMMDEDSAAALTVNLNDNWNDNIYARPVNQDSITFNGNWFYRRTGWNGTQKNFNYKNSQWVAAWGHDTRTTGSPKLFNSNDYDPDDPASDTIFHQYINESFTTDMVFALPRTLMDMRGGIHFAGEQYTLKPLEGVMFLAHTATKPTDNTGNPTQFAGYRFYYKGNIKLYKNIRTGRILYRPLPYVPQNLFAYSEQVDNAIWDKPTGLTVTANAGAAPDASTTAELIEETAGVTSAKNIRQTVAVIKDSVYTLSLYVKANGRNYVQLSMSATGGGFLGTAFADFDLSTGAVSLQGASLMDADITALADGWYRASITAKAVATVATGTPFFLPVNSATAPRLTSYAGESGKGFYAWGLQFNTGLIKPYTKTVAAAIP